MGKSYRKWLFRVRGNQMIKDDDNVSKSTETLGVSLKKASETIKKAFNHFVLSTDKAKKGGK